jgi:hypothetical protein
MRVRAGRRGVPTVAKRRTFGGRAMKTTTGTREGTRGRALLPLVAVNLLSSLGFSVVVPFLVFLVTGPPASSGSAPAVR